MKSHIGIKIVNSKPLSWYEYNQFRGWRLSDAEADAPGYLVEYTDGGAPNTEEYSGYVSWSPADVFERAYQPMSGMSFGMAIAALELGRKVARAGWNGKNMFLFLVPGSTFEVNRPPLMGIYPEGTEINYLPHIDMKTADDKVVPWLASQSDILAKDWIEVE